ncbi:30S ribosomal protein S4 [Candidatus Nomurabacteria bacterium]|nr:30S ribosomal protein S4 [Candidatus Nomurabacteria bacterium]
MKIGPKYKIARRLGAEIFEKTQTQKFAIRQSQKKDGDSKFKQRTDFGKQVLEKQKVRFTYGIMERQFSKYVKNIINKQAGNPEEKLFQILESRLDNVVLRAGFAKTRFMAKQMVGHGHIMVNGKKTDIPSCQVSVGDKITIRPGSSKSVMFADLSERLKNITIPSWLKVDLDKKEITVQGKPVKAPGESLLNLSAVIQYYKR